MLSQNLDGLSDAELFGRLKCNNSIEAFNALYNRYAPQLFIYIKEELCPDLDTNNSEKACDVIIKYVFGYILKNKNEFPATIDMHSYLFEATDQAAIHLTLMMNSKN